jgi:hypothetical protein
LNGDRCDETKDYSGIENGVTLVKIEETSTGAFDLSFKQNFNKDQGSAILGIERLSIECSNGKDTKENKPAKVDGKTTREFNYKQIVNPCLNSLSKTKGATYTTKKMGIDYQDITESLLVDDFESKITVKSDSTTNIEIDGVTANQCAPTCTLLNENCDSGSSGDTEWHSLKDNFKLRTVQNFQEGYTSAKSCIKCKTRDSDDEETFVFESSQNLRCHAQLTKKANLPFKVEDEGVVRYEKDTRRNLLG